MKKLIIGWKERCSFPDLGICEVIFKTDTGATLSALHATTITTEFKDGKEYVSFFAHPSKKDKKIKVACYLPVKRRKMVTSSNGFKEKRIVVETAITVGKRTWKIELTLTNRATMTYRMLLGRQAMKYMIIKPKKTFLTTLS